MAASLGTDDCNLSTAKETAMREMISRLACTDAHFKHQQRGDPDLKTEEKEKIAREILEKSPAKFLERFSKFLTREDIHYFDDLKGDYMIDFYLQEINKHYSSSHNSVVKNRRLNALQTLMEKGDYFSENEMKWRDPLLFEEMVGQYETEAEQDKREIDMNDLKFSSILLKNIDAISNRELYDKQKETEACQLEEEDESSDEEEMDSSSESEDDDTDPEKDRELENNESRISDMDKSHLKEEFLTIMQERFLSGGDQNYDYTAVDDNTEYDDLDIMSHDAEEKYFDEDDDQESCMSGGSGDVSDTTSCINHCANVSAEQGLKLDEVFDKKLSHVSDGEELDIRTGLRSIDLKQTEQEEIEDYMTYEPSEELVQTCVEGLVSER